MNLTINNIPNYNNTNFKAKIIYKSVKNVPTVCACCGEKMILPEKMRQAYATISKPLSKVVQKGYLDFYKQYAQIWSVIQDLIKKYPTQTLDRILDNEEEYILLRDAVTKTFASTKGDSTAFARRKIDTEYNKLLVQNRSQLRTAPVVMRRFKLFKNSLSGQRLQAFEQFEIYASKYPRKSLSEIVQMDEIYKFHKAKDILQKSQEREKINYRFDNILKLIKKHSPENEDYFYELKEQALDILYNGAEDGAIRKEMLLDLYKMALKEKDCSKIEKKVLNELKDLPTTIQTMDSFFATAHEQNYSDSQIVASILNPSLSTFEHIIPVSKGGKDSIYNGIILCQECNRKRGNLPYTSYIKYHPEMKRNTQRQINQICNFIIDGKLSLDSYKYYPIKIAETLENYSEGVINVNVDKYIEKALKSAKERYRANESQISEITDTEKELRKKIAALESKIRQGKKAAEALADENHKEYSFMAYLNGKKNSK
ncbi:MAG: HNH endonuclease [bacterium]|nr:HNH endonuclease [bacterium]